MTDVTNEAAETVREIARVPTAHAQRYLGQLCKHFAHKIPVEHSEREGRITFGAGVCRATSDEAALTLDAVTGTSVLPWPQVVEVQALPRHVALRFAQGSVFAIPDRAFAEPAARAAFLDALATRRAAAR